MQMRRPHRMLRLRKLRRPLLFRLLLRNRNSKASAYSIPPGLRPKSQAHCFLARSGPCVNLLGRMKDIYIADLATFDEGKLFDGYFLLLVKQQRTTKTNKPYLNLIM